MKPDAPDQSNINSDVNKRLYYVYMLQPYTKNYSLFSCPDVKNGFFPGSGKAVAFQNANGSKAGNNYGGQ
ncbi:hypothetical protein, partial [Klebsiella pneumoniae]|uniref:hypothetical protein n=1 Tax=Klebsiella pneumoniae TaxID=573 RepID=UPI0038526BC1